MDYTSNTNNLTDKYIKYRKQYRKKQLALKALLSYTEQLKIHYDLTENDLIKILKIILKTKDKNDIIKKLWNIFK